MAISIVRYVQSNFRLWKKNSLLLNDWLKDEYRATIEGCRAYDQQNSVFALRRDIHRIEKGLSHYPLRIFGLSYIVNTVIRYSEYINRKGGGSKEAIWFFEILSKYFKSFPDHPGLKTVRSHFLSISMPASIEIDKLERPAGKTIPFEAVISLMESRTSIRKFLPKQIPEEIIRNACVAAKTAPSACNRQSTRFVFLKGEAVRRIGAVLPGARTFIDQVPTLMFAVGDLSAFPQPSDRHTIYLDAAFSVGHMLLAFKSLGVDSCVVNWPDIHENNRYINEQFALSTTERIAVVVAIGYSDQEAKPLLSIRGPVEDFYIIM